MDSILCGKGVWLGCVESSPEAWTRKINLIILLEKNHNVSWLFAATYMRPAAYLANVSKLFRKYSIMPISKNQKQFMDGQIFGPAEHIPTIEEVIAGLEIHDFECCECGADTVKTIQKGRLFCEIHKPKTPVNDQGDPIKYGL